MKHVVESSPTRTLRAEAIELLRMASRSRRPASAEQFQALALRCIDLAQDIEREREKAARRDD
jgi:hypothetical protein